MTRETVLSELERDALTELVNIGVSRAAVSLQEMVSQQVHLAVPMIALVSRSEAIRLLREREPDNLIAVQQTFEGSIAGRALLIFPQTKSLELVRAITKSELSLEDIIELEQEALAETGNIILNGCLATIANLLKCSLRMTLPEILHGGGSDFFAMASLPTSEDVVMFLYIDFTVREHDIRGYICMLMDMPSLKILRGLIRNFLERTTDQAEF